MNQSPRLGLSYILPNQAQKHVSANESFRRLDALVQLTANSASQSVEPQAPDEGDVYILPADRSGESWGAMAASSLAAFQDGAWMELPPRAGWRAYVADEGRCRTFDGSAWTTESAPQWTRAPALGVNTDADQTNRLAVKSESALFTHDDAGAGDARLIVNKSAAPNTASVVFQIGFSGRAEIGLAGTEDLALKVSADGASWRDALVVKTDGRIGLRTAAPAAPLELHVDGSDTAAALISSDDLVIAKESGPASFAGIVASPSASARMVFKGTKARGALGAPAAAASGDQVFSLLGAVFDGGQTRGTAGVEFVVDGPVSSGVAPQRIVFSTGEAASRAERLRITASGDVGIGVAAPTARLDVDGPIKMKSYAKSALPSAAAAGAGAIVFVSNEAGGAVLAFSDGAGWRRVTDRALVS
jgi:hypothetical protein